MAGWKKREGPLNYFELPRKQLQSLCKKYGFPANKTNQLMAEFLTAQLNSDEPSPAVKTRNQCLYEQPTTDNSLPTTSESQRGVESTEAIRLSHEFMNTEATHNDRPFEAEASTAPETEPSTELEAGLGQGTQINSDAVLAECCPLEVAMTFTTPCFRFRDACLPNKRESGQDTLLRPSTTVEAINITKDCEMDPSRGSLTDPLPLSVMPYMCPLTPDSCAVNDSGVKPFVDFENDGLSHGQNLRDYYRAWGAPLTSGVTSMQDEGVVGCVNALEGSVLDTHTDSRVNKADRAAEEVEGKENFLLQTPVVSTSSKETDAASLKSCSLTPNRKPSQLNASFLCPPIFSSPRSMNGLVFDSNRSDIVKEWSVDQTQDSTQPIGVIPCSGDYMAVNGELVLRNLDQMVDSTDNRQAEEGISAVVKEEKCKESACEAVINSGDERNVQRRPDTMEYVSTESQNASEDSSKSDGKVAEKPTVAFSFLDIDFTQMKVQNAVGLPPPRIESETNYTMVGENKSIPLSPLDSNRLAIEAVADSSPNPITPTKSCVILDDFSEIEEDNAKGLSLFGKENEWSRRQDEHKTPLTGRSKEKSLRTAERKASSLREQLLRKRRGMMMGDQIDGSDSLSMDLSPLKQLATNRLL